MTDQALTRGQLLQMVANREDELRAQRRDYLDTDKMCHALRDQLAAMTTRAEQAEAAKQ